LPDDFNLSAYVALVQALHAQGYKIRGYADVAPNDPHLILRHDVDFDLGAAVELATVEAEQDWAAYYFVLMGSEFYNPLSPASGAAISLLRRLGHRVGLHFDASVYSGDTNELISAVQREASILEDITGAEVDAFSLHRPHPELLDHGFDVPGMVNVYATRYTQEIAYCSDSRGQWRHGHPLDLEAVHTGRALHLLTHPVWWVHAGGTPQATVARTLDKRFEVLEEEADAQCETFQARITAERKE
tara:strand:- start:396 stop:1130 length:735 start_codon:yes stop_codon:yes gene_type:complete